MIKEKVIEMINTGKSLAEKYPRLDVTTDDLNHVLEIYEGNIYKTPRALYYMGVAKGAITAKEKIKEKERINHKKKQLEHIEKATDREKARN